MNSLNERGDPDFCGVKVIANPFQLFADDWRPGQRFGRQVRAQGLDGVQYQSVRYPAAQAAAMFWPNCLTLPIVQAQQYRYRWDGTRMTHYLLHGATDWTPWPVPGVV